MAGHTPPLNKQSNEGKCHYPALVSSRLISLCAHVQSRVKLSSSSICLLSVQEKN